jgi:hypothetical protein
VGPGRSSQAKYGPIVAAASSARTAHPIRRAPPQMRRRHRDTAGPRVTPGCGG